MSDKIEKVWELITFASDNFKSDESFKAVGILHSVANRAFAYKKTTSDSILHQLEFELKLFDPNLDSKELIMLYAKEILGIVRGEFSSTFIKGDDTIN